MKTTIILTKENASKASTITNIKNPEWGYQRFNYNAQPLLNGCYASTRGSGSNSAVVYENEYKYWAVNSWK